MISNLCLAVRAVLVLSSLSAYSTLVVALDFGDACPTPGGPACGTNGILKCIAFEDGNRCAMNALLGDDCSSSSNRYCNPGLVCSAGRCASQNGAGVKCGGNDGLCPGSDFACQTDKVGTYRCYKISPPLTFCDRSTSDNAFTECGPGTTCTEASRCLPPPGIFGSTCNGQTGVYCPESKGLYCRTVTGEYPDYPNGTGTCSRLARRGEGCNPSAHLFCDFNNLGISPVTLESVALVGRTTCVNGVCVKSPIGLLGDKCGDGLGITCFSGDECGLGALECLTTIGGGPVLEVKNCVSRSIGRGQVCPVASGRGDRIFLQCVEGARCDLAANPNNPIRGLQGLCV
jgi:hypothetical protein